MRKQGTEALNNSFKVIYPAVQDSQQPDSDPSAAMFCAFCHNGPGLVLVSFKPPLWLTEKKAPATTVFASSCSPCSTVLRLHLPKHRTKPMALLLTIPSMPPRTMGWGVSRTQLAKASGSRFPPCHYFHYQPLPRLTPPHTAGGYPHMCTAGLPSPRETLSLAGPGLHHHDVCARTSPLPPRRHLPPRHWLPVL